MEMRGEMGHRKTLEFIFDDEPLDRILYGKSLGGPTPASLFSHSARYVREICQLFPGGNIQEALEKASELAAKRYAISKGMRFKLADIMKAVVPSFPNPEIQYDLSGLRPLLEQIWKIAPTAEDKKLQEGVSTPLFRWYEHHQKYEDARRVLEVLIRWYQEQGDPSNEGA